MESCFSCGEIGKCTDLYARKPFECQGPYFPIFERFNSSSSSNLISPEGTVKVCELCHLFLLSQWQNYERQGISESRRIYFTKRQDSAFYNNNDPFLISNADINFGMKSNYISLKNGDQKLDSSIKTSLSTVGNSPSKGCFVVDLADKIDLSFKLNVDVNHQQLSEHHIRCFVCGLPCLKWHAKTAYSSQVLENKEYFPFFEKLDPPQLSIGLTNGATKICIECESDLQKQWEHYESLGTDQMRRTYHITNDHNNVFSITNPGRFITNSLMNNPLFSLIKLKSSIIKCALCPNKVIDPYTVSWSQRASCLSISNLKKFSFPTEGVMVDKQSEEAVICDICHYFLSYQLQTFNTNMTPLHLREYKLPKVRSLSPISPLTNDKQITVNRKPVTLGSSLSAFSAPECGQQFHSQLKRSKTPTLKNQLKTQVHQYSKNNRQNYTSKPSVFSQDQRFISEPIIANCYICLHELRYSSTVKKLSSTANEENSNQPYFPFLKTFRLNSMKNDEFSVCVHCYHNLHGQWRMFQKAALPINEYKYNHNEFMCTLCQHLFAQKTDIVIVRDKLLCLSCSENRGCEVTKNVLNVTNQDTDSSSQNSQLSLNVKTTVTVTPISNELPSPNLTSLNYGETMKQLNVTKFFEAAVISKPISTSSVLPLSTSVNQFGDIPRNSYSIHSEMYQNSKNVFSKNIKRPVVATVAPNQRQNTPHETMPMHSDFRIKIPDITNYHGNPYNQNLGFNLFSDNSNNYPSQMFSSNSAFSLHSPYSNIGRKSTKCERDTSMQYPSNISNPYFEQKSRINTPIAQNNSNPFINWTQHHHPQPEANPPFPIQQFPNFFDQSFPPAIGSNKESEITMLLYMLYQKQMHMSNDPSNKFADSWFNNPSQSLEDMTLNYYQSMMAQHSNSGMFPPEDLLSGLCSSVNNSNSNGIQSYMMNAAVAKYQYNQMFQMLAAYQQQFPLSGMTSNNKSQSNILNWLNQFNITEKRPRPESMVYDTTSHSKQSSTSNGFSDILKYSELLKSSIVNDHEKLMTSKYPSTNIHSQIVSNDSRTSHNQRLLEHSTPFDKIKTIKQAREDHCFSEMKRNSESSSKLFVTNTATSQDSKRHFKINSETNVLDLSQELAKPPNVSSQYESNESSTLISPLNDHKKSDNILLSVCDLKEPLNINTVCQDQSKETRLDCCLPESQNKQNSLITFLRDIDAVNLIDILKTTQTIRKGSKSLTSNFLTFSKCSTVLKFHKFLNCLDRLYLDFNNVITVQTRNKTSFMKELGLQSCVSQKTNKKFKTIESYIMQGIKKFPISNHSKNEHYWTKWILKNLENRLSIKMKPHLRRSLMRPVLSGDIEVRLCTAKQKHELETLRSIIKILSKFT